MADDLFDPSPIAEPFLRKCHDYWLSKCSRAGPPARGDIDPVEMVDFLPNVILVNTAPVVTDFTFRLFGTGVVFGFGEDRTGMRLGDLGVRETLGEAIEGYWRCYRDAKPVYLRDRPVELERVRSYSRLTLPLSRDGALVDMLLGCVDFSYLKPAEQRPKGAIGRARDAGNGRSRPLDIAP